MCPQISRNLLPPPAGGAAAHFPSTDSVVVSDCFYCDMTDESAVVVNRYCVCRYEGIAQSSGKILMVQVM